MKDGGGRVSDEDLDPEILSLDTQGGVSVDRERVEDPNRTISAGNWLVQVGKRRFARVNLA